MLSDAIKSKKTKATSKPINIFDLLKQVKLEQSNEKKHTYFLVAAAGVSIIIVASLVVVF